MTNTEKPPPHIAFNHKQAPHTQSKTPSGCLQNLAWVFSSKQATLSKSAKPLHHLHDTSYFCWWFQKNYFFSPHDPNLNLERENLGRESVCFVSVVVRRSEKGTARSCPVLLRPSQTNRSHQELPTGQPTQYLFCKSPLIPLEIRMLCLGA